MTTIEIKVPKLFDSQRVILKDEHRFKVLACGRRYGKTTVAKSDMARRLIRGQSVSFMTPVYKTLEEVWADTKNIVQALITDKNETNRSLTLSTGGKLECWSLLEPNRIRSRGYDYIYIDEAAFVPNLIQTWNKVLRPMLADRLGGAMFMSSPRGYNDFYQLYGMARKDDEWTSFQHATWDNPHIAADEIEKIRKSLPESDFDQEYGAAFTSKSGLIFKEWSDENISDSAVYNSDLPIIWGVDDGYVHGDGIGTASYHPRVILFIQIDPRGFINVIDEYIATLELSEISIQNALNYPYPLPYTAYVDSSAQELKSRIWAKGIQTVNGTHRVQDGIDVVRRYVLNGDGQRLLKVHPKCVNLIHDFEHWAYERTPLGELKPSKIDENCIDGLRYALVTATRGL
jgi:Terminase large subunit, T4likevirus-type, N-terminal